MAEPVQRPLELGAASYAVRLPEFDGPLDLMLHLVRQARLNILDIEIHTLTAAYLASLREMEALQIEPASEFLLWAATLLQIKSRMLLPRPPSLESGEAPEDPRLGLMVQLLEYQRFREVAEGLDERAMVGRDTFLRPAGLDRPAPTGDEALASQDVYRLAEAFRALLARGQFEAPHNVYVERISIGERIAQIADQLSVEPRCTFKALCTGARYREELITTFLALLEMSRLKLIHLVQADRLEPLHVEARAGAIGELGEEAAALLGE